MKHTCPVLSIRNSSLAFGMLHKLTRVNSPVIYEAGRVPVCGVKIMIWRRLLEIVGPGK